MELGMEFEDPASRFVPRPPQIGVSYHLSSGPGSLEIKPRLLLV